MDFSSYPTLLSDPALYMFDAPSAQVEVPAPDDFDLDLNNLDLDFPSDFVELPHMWKPDEQILPPRQPLPSTFTSGSSEYTSDSMSNYFPESEYSSVASNSPSNYSTNTIDSAFSKIELKESVASELFNERLRQDATIDPSVFCLPPTPPLAYSFDAPSVHSEYGGRSISQSTYDESPPYEPLARIVPSQAGRAKKDQCPFCSLSFDRTYNLKTHITAKHLGLKPFPCPHEDCTSAFARKHDLSRHRATVHKDPSLAHSARSAGVGRAKRARSEDSGSSVQHKVKRPNVK